MGLLRQMGFSRRGFWEALASVVAGNAIYFSLERYLPPAAHHALYQVDWGLAVDFWFCVACYGLLRLLRK